MHIKETLEKIISKDCSIQVFGLGYVGFPLSIRLAKAGFKVTGVGASVIDLDSLEKDRMVRVYGEFVDFDLSDGYFLMKIIQPSTGKIISESKIYVASTAEGLINFNSHVVYLISDEAIKNGNIMTGDYQMQITTKDGSAVEHIPFSIIDTRE